MVTIWHGIAIKNYGTPVNKYFKSCCKSWNIPIDIFEAAAIRTIKNNSEHNCIIALVKNAPKYYLSQNNIWFIESGLKVPWPFL